MIQDEDMKDLQESCWVELANGGGVLFRNPSAPVVSPPQYTPLRRTKELAGHVPARSVEPGQ